MTEKEFEMGAEKFLDASTGYITDEDRLKLLDDPTAFPTRVIPHEFGWWINVPSIEYLEEDDKLHQIKQCGYSDLFVNLIKFAAKHDCWCINLDCDGEVLDDEEMDGLAEVKFW